MAVKAVNNTTGPNRLVPTLFLADMTFTDAKETKLQEAKFLAKL